MAADSSFNVEHWLKATGASLYAADFTDHGYVTYERCVNLSEDDLRAIVNNDSHVQMLMQRVKILRQFTEEDAVKLLSSQNISLYVACQDGDVKLAQQLITNGANVNWRNPLQGENTPVYAAANIGNVDLLNMLIDAGGDVNIANVSKQTPVLTAAFRGHVGALNVLIRAKADVNTADVDQRTPAHAAANFGHVDILKTLHQHGAHLNTKDKRNMTPLDYAIERNHSSVVDFLKTVDSKPITLPHILAFPFKTGVANIVQRIAGSRDVFGVLLLEDNDGSIVNSVAASNQPPIEITLAIVRYWIQGNGRQPISWYTFIDTVRKAGLVTLANDIREGLGNLQ